MGYDHHAVLGFVAVVIGVIGYIPYYRDILRGTTKPHPFSWLGFGILNGITFIAQVVSGGGPGTWVTAITTISTFGIAILAFTRGEKGITIFDWICFAGALVGIIFWKLTSNPLWAVIIVTIADLLAFAPTFRKAFLRPYEETISLYAMSILKYAISLGALAVFNVTTAFFPATLVISNGSFVVLLILRRQYISPITRP
jgi:hypothetical protein